MESKQPVVRFRWLGVGGVELECDGIRIVIDPFLTRPPMRYLLAGRPRTDRMLMDRRLPKCQAIFVTHAHYDHMMDVPSLAMRDGAAVYGSENVCQIAAAYGVDSGHLHVVESGGEAIVGRFQIRSWEGRHGRIFGMVPYRGALSHRLCPPLPLADFRMDRMFSYEVIVDGTHILFWNRPDALGAVRADILFMMPQLLDERLQRLLQKTETKKIIPIHWDNFFSPADSTPQEFLMPGSWPFRSAHVDRFVQRVRMFAPNTEVIRPKMFEYFEIGRI
jgi:hypothetical protein